MPDESQTSRPDWEAQIGRSVLLRQQLNTLEGDLSPYTIPSAGARPDQLADASSRVRLDRLHADLLSFANGWPHFFNYMHLLSTNALGQKQPGSLWADAESLLDIFFDGGSPVPDLPARGDLYTIAGNPAEEQDLLVAWTIGPVVAGGRAISWLAEGEEVQRFDNAWELLLSVNAYFARDIEKARDS